MPRAVLLRCPVCDSLRAFEGSRDDYSTEELWATAKTHLRDHLLGESKTALRKHQTAAEADEIIVSAGDVGRLPTDEWRHPSDAWLPDGVDSGGAAADSRPTSLGEPLSSRPNARD